MKSIMSLDDILDYLDDLEYNRHDEYVNLICGRFNQRRVKARIKADAARNAERSYHEPTELRGALGAEREG